MASEHQSQACCNVPAAVVDHYEKKGKMIELENGMKCYVTGPASATSAIFMIYDIFGFSDQFYQGADILAHADAAHQYRVFAPDLAEGQTYSGTYPPSTDAEKKKLGDFFSGVGAPPRVAGVVPGVVKAIAASAEGKGVQKWGSAGFCWGAKVVSLTAGSGTPFSVAAECHPAMVTEDDAKAFTIPVCMLASGDEDAEAIKKFDQALTVDKYIETFTDQIHGWMGARGDLKQERVRKEYERGYTTLLDWFHKYI